MDAQSEALLMGVLPELASRIRQMASALSAQGIRIKVVSGHRSTERQRQLYANRAANPYPVAVPGTSAHERRRAVDVGVIGGASAATWQRIGAVGKQLGLRWGGDFRRSDPVHFELSSSRAQQIPEPYTADYVLEPANLMLLGVVAFAALALVSVRSRK
jgi:uncharacterized protein YcbK (DUF882 family)